MVLLKELAGTIGQREVKVRGRPVIVRALAAGHDAVIRRVMPRPAPPVGPDPKRGSLSRMVRSDDPAYQTEHAEWFRKYRAVCLAVAVGARVEAPGGAGGMFEAGEHGFSEHYSDEQLLEWCGLVVQQMTCAFTAAELMLLDETLSDIDGTEELAGLAGN